MSSKPLDEILEQGERSALLSTVDAGELRKQLSERGELSTEEVAAALIEKHVLTPYQAEQLVAGRAEECLIAGRYCVLEKLGAGGMGVVYKARDTQLSRLVALKVLAAHRLEDAGASARFQREARALARLSHPNIIQAYDSGVDRGQPFLVMEFVEGVSLAALLRECGAVPPTLAADMAYQAALGLRHAHSKGLVHRDLKPANLFWSGTLPPGWTGPGVVKVLDLGLVRFVQDQLGDSQVTREGVGLGTPDYMAPEQFHDAAHADARTDVYGLGCTLYHLIGGSVPFPGSSFSEKGQAHARREPAPLEERCPEVPAGLALIVGKMMAKRPADRFQTAAEVAEALAPYVAGSSQSMVTLRNTLHFRAGQLTARPRKRVGPILALAGIVAAALIALTTLVWPELSPSTDGGTQATAPTAPAVVTLDNGVTVAKDGSGQFATIGEALAGVGPGMTIRVLDGATYRESIVLDKPDKQRGVTLEAVKGATLEMPDGAAWCVQIENVPGVCLRGFRITEQRGVSENRLVGVRGEASGVTLDRLLIEDAAHRVHGIVLEEVRASDGAQPLVISNCRVRVSYDGIKVVGPSTDDANSARGGILIHDNQVERALRGILIEGAVQDLQITGNVVRNCGQVGIQVQNPTPATRRILLVNNSLIECSTGLRVWDDAPYSKLTDGQVELRNNLLLRAASGDIQFWLYDGGKYSPGDFEALATKWRLGHNHRDLSGREFGGKMNAPLAAGDVKLNEDDLLSRNPQNQNFLRPKPGSALAQGGAGGVWPVYVGAIPPEGTAPWDWAKTWATRVKQHPENAGPPPKP